MANHCSGAFLAKTGVVIENYSSTENFGTRYMTLFVVNDGIWHIFPGLLQFSWMFVF